MTRETESDASGTVRRLYSLVPQDKSTGVYKIAAGLSLSEWGFVVVPPLVLLYVLLNVVGVDPSRPLLVLLSVSFLVLFYAVQATPYYLTPVEIVSRNVSYLRERVRMPLATDEARDVPGVIDVHSAHDAVHREDDALVGAVRVEPTNTSQLSEDDWTRTALTLAHAMNARVSRDEEAGFDTQIYVRQTEFDPTEVRRLEAATDCGRVPEVARDVAAHRAGHYYETLAESGVMDREMFVVVPVDPAEGDDEGFAATVLDAVPGVRPSEERRQSQADVLDRRLSEIERVAEEVSSGRRVSAADLVELLRTYWLDDLGVDEFEPTVSVTDGGVLPGLEGTGTSRSDGEQRGGGERRGETGEGRGEGGERRREAGEERRDTGERDRTNRNGDGDDPIGTEDREEPDRFTALDRWSRGSFDVYSPAYVDEYPKYVELNQQYTSTLWVTGWPKNPAPGILDDILATPGVRYDLAIHAGAVEFHEKQDELRREQDSITGMAILREDDGDSSAADADSVASQKQALRDHMRENDVETSEVSMAITVRATDPDRLARVRKRLISEASDENILLRPAHKRQFEGLRTTSPVATDALADSATFRTTFDMPSDTLGCLFPFGTAVHRDEDGLIYGLAKQSPGDGAPLGPLVVDRDACTSPHRFIVGRSGSGKTFGEGENVLEDHVRSLASQERNEVKTVITDISRGYDGVVEALDGERIVVGETPINPFAINPPSEAIQVATGLSTKIELLTSMFTTHLEYNAAVADHRALQPTLQQAIRLTYQRRGITDDPQTHGKESPTMRDFFAVLEEMADAPETFTAMETDVEIEQLRTDVGTLLKQLKPFHSDGQYGYLHAEGDGLGADLYSDLVLLDLHEFENRGSAERGMLMALLTSHAYEVAKQTDRRVNFVVDEAHTMFSDEEQARRLASLVRAGRNYDLAFDFISQVSADFREGPASIIADQCSIAIWHDIGAVDAGIATEFGLTDEQARLVAGRLDTGDNDATNRSEALVDVEGDRYVVEKAVSPFTKHVLEYRADRDGPFEEYVERWAS